MKRMILTGIAVVAAGLSGLWAQQPAAPAAPKGPVMKSQAEQKAVQAVQAAVDPDATIKAAEDLMNQFADTDFKEYALTMEANAYQRKARSESGPTADKDNVNAQVYGERVLAINPKSFSMELLVGEVVEIGIKDHDLNRDDEISRCNKMFTDAIENIKTAVKPNPQIPDKDWSDAQKFITAQAHNDLGVLAQVQKHWDDAIKEYQAAWDGDSEQDAYGTRLANAYLASGKNEQAVTVCDKLLAKPDLHPAIKNVVNQIKANASKK